MGLTIRKRRIAEENVRVRAESTSHVTVALLDPLIPTPMSGLPPAQVRNRLEGAYTALRRVNTTPVAGDTKPQIQLVLANADSTDGQWHRVIGQLVELSKQENPLVAVVGLGISTAQTQQRAEQLSDQRIPMIGAVLTADVLDHDRIGGLIKTSPSNRHYVEALRGYMNSADLNSAVMVRDSNSDEGVALFTQTLAEQFEKQMDLTKFTPQSYSGQIRGDDKRKPFSIQTANICASVANGLQAILFAGREVNFGYFVESLEQRSCRTESLTILTAGSDLGAVLNGRERMLDKAELTVISAATVDAEGWRQDAPGTPEYFHEFLSAFQEQGFNPENLNDGGAIMMHDALLTAARAIRLAAHDGSVLSATAVKVRDQLLNLNGEFEVHAASGTLSFSARSPGAGNPMGKPVPVLQYPRPSDSSSRQVGGQPYFVTN